MLVPERRLKNITDREEGIAVQYLTLGGYRHYMCSNEHPVHVENVDDDDEAGGKAKVHRCGNNDMKLVRAGSALHAGAGQQVLGWNKSQRADLLLAFRDAEGRSVLHYHNHHEIGTHYTGHVPLCWKAETAGSYYEHTLSRRCDSFREGLAKALTSVRPDRVKFYYTRTTTCELMHGSDLSPEVGSTRPGCKQLYATAAEACLLERTNDFIYLPEKERRRAMNVEGEVLPGIANGSLTGFVTIKGGRESQEVIDRCPAAARFGFCVQKYAPTDEEISDFTKRQISDYHGLDSEIELDKILDRQQSRTVNSGTFHTWETVTTSYLRWLMSERGFCDFEILHLALYNFDNDPRHFLEPILQKRHDAKRRGNGVAAECLKLIGNGSFGYNGLEATNYTTVRLMREETYRKQRYTSLAHRILKHTTLLSVVRQKLKKSKHQRQQRRRQRRQPRSQAGAQFLSSEALDVDDDDDDDDDDEEEEEEEDEIDDETEMLNVLGLDEEPGDDGDDDDDDAVLNDGDDDVNDDDGEDDEAVARQDARVFGTDPDKIAISCLYAVDVSGEDRQLFNNLPKAVAVLGNSKRLFFSHLLTMFECLDPALAELCYVDTDSCLWSFTYEVLEDNLLAEKRSLWKARAIIADESSKTSCHGKMKLEGTYKAGLFRTSKIYRLFGATNYTRCKGVNRHQANRLLDRHFDIDFNSATVVHRRGLRPTRTGEMVIANEPKKLSVPFNLKRHVTQDGIHTLPFSMAAAEAGGGTDSDDDDDDDDDNDGDGDDDNDVDDGDYDNDVDDDDSNDERDEHCTGVRIVCNHTEWNL